MTQVTMLTITLFATAILLYLSFKIFHEQRPLIKSFRSIIFSTGIMTAINIFGDKIGISMPLNFPNLIAVGILGIPGICLMIILNAIF